MKTGLSGIFLFVMFFTINAQNITYIDLSKPTFESIHAETIFSELEIIPLETHEEALLHTKSTYYVTDHYIIAASLFNGTYLFDRKSGAFIREVSSFGQGPNEMIAAIDPEDLIEYKDEIDSKYKKLFQNLREDDNPIIIIGKVKE